MSKLNGLKFTTAKLQKADLIISFAAQGLKQGLKLGKQADALLQTLPGGLAAYAEAAGFQGKLATATSITVPEFKIAKSITLFGLGVKNDMDQTSWRNLGGKVGGLIGQKANKLPGRGKTAKVAILLDSPDPIEADAAAEFAAGIKLRLYTFDKYKTKKDADKKPAKNVDITIHLASKAGIEAAHTHRDSVATGTILARDLVNEPPNILGPLEFAKIAKDLTKHGLKVDVLDDKKLKELKMGALLAVAQGSRRPARLVTMSWNGGKKGDAPIAFVGKGVVFDTGGISIKPGGGMEDMKGDMGGAAAVTGLMQALTLRNAKVNAVGIIGIVENMPDGNAYRPGDIITSKSGQTIEIVNTDAEGRLVLADALTYTQDKFKPKFIVNLATLTGATLVGLGQHYAGLFSNDDTLSQNLTEAGLASGEKVWRMPLSPDYDKLINSRFADMKNTGGRFGGSITAGQFLQRYVAKDMPWAHLDIAGTAFASPTTDISTGWASGYGVALLDQMVADKYET